MTVPDNAPGMGPDADINDAGPLAQPLYLNVVPTGFAFSGIHTETDRFGVSFVLDGTTVVSDKPQKTAILQLPPLREVAFSPVTTDFDLLLRAGYSRLEQALSPWLLDRRFSSDSAAGKVTVMVRQLRLSGNDQGITVSLEFSAWLPGSRRETLGTVHLYATPVVDADSQQLRLENIRLSRVLDSTLWSLVSSVFEGQIIAGIEKASIIDLKRQTRRLEERLQTQLEDPTRTGGIQVSADKLSIALLEIIPEADNLAARVRVSAELDVDIPLTVLEKPLK